MPAHPPPPPPLPTHARMHAHARAHARTYARMRAQAHGGRRICSHRCLSKARTRARTRSVTPLAGSGAGGAEQPGRRGEVPARRGRGLGSSRGTDAAGLKMAVERSTAQCKRGSCLAISMHFNFCRFSSSVPVERAHSSTCNAHIAAQCQVPLRCLATSGSDAQSRARHLRVRSAGRSSGSLGCWQVVRVKNGLCEGHDSWFTAGFRVRARALADGRVYEVLLCGVPCAVVVSVSASI